MPDTNTDAEPKFVVDRMLGRLTAWLRLLGYDTLSANDRELAREEDNSLIATAGKEKRIILSRDKALVKKAQARGITAIYINPGDVVEQLARVHSHFNLHLKAKMIRCTVCNSPIRTTAAEEMEEVKAKEYVFPDLLERNTEFWICDGCKRVYWEGSHWNNIQKTLEELRKQAGALDVKTEEQHTPSNRHCSTCGTTTVHVYIGWGEWECAECRVKGRGL